MDALRKMRIMPARRLEAVSPAMRRKGQERADADLSPFDSGRVLDTADFARDLSFSDGIRHVLVAGRPVVKDSATGRLPGPRGGRRYCEGP
jgi:hypothetical protein